MIVVLIFGAARGVRILRLEIGEVGLTSSVVFGFVNSAKIDGPLARFAELNDGSMFSLSISSKISGALRLIGVLRFGSAVLH